jgi:hypothetical protein
MQLLRIFILLSKHVLKLVYLFLYKHLLCLMLVPLKCFVNLFVQIVKNMMINKNEFYKY